MKLTVRSLFIAMSLACVVGILGSSIGYVALANPPCDDEYPKLIWCPDPGTNKCNTVQDESCDDYEYIEQLSNYFDTTAKTGWNAPLNTVTDCTVAWYCWWDDLDWYCNTSNNWDPFNSTTRGTYYDDPC